MYYRFYELRDFWDCVVKNHTDGFMATTLWPKDMLPEKFPAYLQFNCYGSFGPYLKNILSVPRKHRRPIVEVFREKSEQYDNSISVSVSESPKILLKGKRLQAAISRFNEQEWEQVFTLIAFNRDVIMAHWVGDSSSLELLEKLTKQC